LKTNLEALLDFYKEKYKEYLNDMYLSFVKFFSPSLYIKERLLLLKKKINTYFLIQNKSKIVFQRNVL